MATFYKPVTNALTVAVSKSDTIHLNMSGHRLDEEASFLSQGLLLSPDVARRLGTVLIEAADTCAPATPEAVSA